MRTRTKLEKTVYKASRIHTNGHTRYMLLSPTGGMLHVKILARKNGYLMLREDRRMNRQGSKED